MSFSHLRSARATLLALSLATFCGCTPQPTDPDDEPGAEDVGEAQSALATCFCKISKDDLTNQTSATGVLLDLTSTVNYTYSGFFQQSDANQTDCNTRCTSAAAPYTGSQAVATSACAAGAPDGTVVRAWSGVGTKEYKSAQQIGTLNNDAAQTQLKCPVGWASNTTNVDGGVTSDGKCKKLSAQPMSVTPLPPNGTPIGTYGFTWGNAVYAWGTPANGGAAYPVTIMPAVCSF